MREKFIVVFLLMIVFGASGLLVQQYVSFEKALNIDIANYGTIRTEEAYTQEVLRRVKQQKRAYFPNHHLSAQNNFCTVKGLLSQLEAPLLKAAATGDHDFLLKVTAKETL